jgi:hypothetical protein
MEQRVEHRIHLLETQVEQRLQGVETQLGAAGASPSAM